MKKIEDAPELKAKYEKAVTKYPTQEELQEVFEYIDEKLWRKSFVDTLGHRRPRKLVENRSNSCDGYCQVKFKGRMVRYHVVVFVLLKGDIPAGYVIDHIDGNTINNNISNLRLVTNRQNNQNRAIHRNGRLVGCFYDKQRRKWRAQIGVNGKRKYLGLFDTEQEAHEAYTGCLEEIENESLCNR